MKLEEEIKTKGFRSFRERALIEVLFTANWFEGKHTNFLKPYNLSTQQYNILRILRGSAPDCLTVNEVKSRMLDKTPNTTRLVDKLLDKDLVERSRCENDRRVVYVRIKQSGMDLLTQIDNARNNLELGIENISEEEAQVLSQLLERIRT